MNNQPVTQCIHACRRGHDNLPKSKSSIRMGKNWDLNDSECSMVVGARWAGLSIFENLLIYWDCHVQMSEVDRE